MKKELIIQLFEKFEGACYLFNKLECWSARELQEVRPAYDVKKSNNGSYPNIYFLLLGQKKTKFCKLIRVKKQTTPSASLALASTPP